MEDWLMRNAKGEGSLWQTDDGWRGYVTVNGRRRYFQAKTKTAAAKKRRELLNIRDTVGLSTGRPVTLKTWINHWLAVTEPKHKPKTHAGYEWARDNLIPSHLLRMPLTKITTETIEDVYTDLAKHYAPTTIHQAHTLLHASLNMALQRGKIATNPASMVVNKPTQKRDAPESLSEADIAAIEIALERSKSRARWMLALSIGLRPGEALGLEWGDLDWETRTLHIHQQLQRVGGEIILVESPKTDAGNRLIQLPEYLIDILRGHYAASMRLLGNATMWSPDKKTHSWMFLSRVKRGYPITPDGDAAQWRHLLKKAGLPHVSRYTTRHTAASVLISHGVDPATVAAILGHADAGFTMRTYVHAVDEQKQRAATMLDGIYKDKVQNRVGL